MGRRRKDAVVWDADMTRNAMLRGIDDPMAVALFDEGMRTLEERGQADFTSGAQMQSAAQWTVVINNLQRKILETLAGTEEADAKLRRLMKSKRDAEESRRKVLDGLLLTPQKKRGRPADETKEEPEEAQDDEWNSFPSIFQPEGIDENEPEEVELD